MPSYLLIWNPNRWQWVDLAECIAKVKAQGCCADRWGVGRNKKIVKGDRLFLMRLGKEPRGICGSGWATSDVFESQHWNENKAALFVELRWDVLLDPDHESILPREILNHGTLAKMKWDSRISGVRISDEAAKELERVWASL
jgi:5-methylcytosine-specific restriction protein A